MKHDDAVIFKGTKAGLWLVLDDHLDYDLLQDKLREKLQEAREFFQNAKVIVNPGKRKMEPAQYHGIADILQKEYGLVLLRWEVNEHPTKKQTGQTPLRSGYGHRSDMLIVNKTLRSGQKINYEGSILVLGDVNPGASIVADGDITVLGVCRGSAHAGASGNTKAIVAAYRLQPTQLRIADLIACAPDGAHVPDCPELARIKGSIVTIETANLR